MSIDKTGSATDDLVSSLDSAGIEQADAPDQPKPRLREAITTRAARVREVAPAQVRRAGSAVREKPAPTAGVLALAGGVIAVLLLRRRAARAQAVQPRRWVPARFQR
ncbi:hypothetical protein [Actinoplanes sp. URMC 104]|uniref:hypothetical protein n=1 Tax=Actinoplanes sp. URMC 104 TaxID=3423409 RepID=UPI003F1C7869